MYPYSSLPENLTAFCAVLRTDYGFRVGPRQLQDAARALEMVRLSDERAVRNTLRPILASSLEDVETFDRAFREFFHPMGTSRGVARERQLQGAHDRDAAARARGSRKASGGMETATQVSARDSEAGSPEDVEDAVNEGDTAALLRSSYSPVHGEGKPLDLMPVDRSWREAAARFVRRVQTAAARRWKPAVHGSRFDLRRTLRSSLHTGAEPVMPRWRARPRLRPRFVMMVDGSRSMAAAAQPSLQVAVALASVTSSVEVFVFSTALERITPEVRRAAGGDPRRLPALHHAWGGGTGIGQCLRDLIHRYGDRVLGPATVVIIASDGLDVGQPDLLQQAMAELRRRSAAIIWLNPLLDTPGYQPTAIGMRLALPALSTFAWASDAAGLNRLARLVRVRR
jgi:uncharacterized protein with von Willebrand factor type A (vWA) domain